ncbi:MAG: hypothetical protein ACFBZ9_13065 [Sphingomonadales bacterium]
MRKSMFVALLSASAILFTGTTSVLAAQGKRGPSFERMLSELDADQSGSLSYAEFAKRGDDRFAATDTNGDGLLTAEERDAAKEAFKEQRGEKAGRAAKAAKKGGRGAAMLDRVDTDQDGSISLAEHNAAQEARFAALDGDGDGSVTEDEFKAQIAERRAKFKEMRSQ